MLEIVLTRIFSFTIWYHLAYLTISTVLLSFGAAGSLLAAFPWLLKRPDRLCAFSAAGAGIMALIAMAYLGPRPIDPITLFDAPIPFFLGLLKYYAILTVPFLLAGISIAAPLAVYPKRVNLLYASDLAGAALGCGLAVAALTWVDGAAALCAAAAIMLAGGTFYARKSRLGFVLGALAIIIAVATPWAHRFINFETVPSKGLGMAKARDDFEQFHTQWSAVNRVDVTRNTGAIRGGFWSLGMRDLVPGPYPSVMNIRYDGHNGSNIYEIARPNAMAFLDRHILRTPYLFLDKPEVLVIGLGGGIDVLNALRREATHVTAAELQPITIEMLQGPLDDFTGNVFNRPDVTLVASEGRHFVRSNPASYDLIQITAVDTFSAQATGAYVLAESFLYTVEAVEDYFDHLTQDGLLCIVLGDLRYKDPDIPSPLGTRVVLTMQEALWRRGITKPASHILLASNVTDRGGERSVVMMKKSPFTPEELALAQSYADVNKIYFRLAPGQPGHPTMTALLNEEPGTLKAALAKQEFHLAPATDDKPFFYHILRWSSILKSGQSVWYFPGSATGQAMLLMMLAQALIFGSLLIALPLIGVSRSALNTTHAVRYLLYFLGLGIGFMLIEISFVQKYVLLLGYPTLSLSVTVVSLLVFAAVGAALSEFGWARPRLLLTGLLLATAVLVSIENLVLPGVRTSLLGTSLPLRILVTVLFQLPLGITLGMFFPTGITLLGQTAPRLVPWAWAVNGIGSVVSTVVAVMLAMSFGFATVSFIAIAIYAIGTIPLILSLEKSGATTD